MKKIINKIVSILMIAILVLSIANVESLASTSAAAANSTVKKAKKISLKKEYSLDMEAGQELWLKVPVKSLVKKKTHITIEVGGVANQISAFYSVKKAEAGVTDASYTNVENKLTYPIAWKGDYYYIKVVATEAGKATYKVVSEKKDPSAPQYQDDFCTAEALAVSDGSLSSLLNGLRSVRDNLLTASDFGQELSDYYYVVSKTIATNLIVDGEFRTNMLSNAKELIPFMNALILLSEGKECSYTFSQKDYAAIEAIKNDVIPKLSTRDSKTGEQIWEKFKLNQFIGKSLTELVETKLLGVQYTMSAETAYSEYIVTCSGSNSITTVLYNVNKFFAENGISVSVSARNSKDLFGNKQKYVLEVKGCSDEELVQSLLEKTKYFENVSVNYQVSLLTNDVQYGYQWYLENKGQEVPHNVNGELQYIAGKKKSDIKYVSMQKYLKSKKRAKVVVAIIDTGINYELADFAGRVDKKKAYNFVNDTTDAMDDNNHGTHVAGIIAANSGNSYSMAGIDSNVTILPIKVLNASGSGDAESLAKAIKYAADNGADVINLSLGMRKEDGTPVMPDDCKEVEEAMKYAVEKKKITIIAAAGNESADNLSYPANSEYTISVGALNNKDELASFTNTGKGLDLVAPGVAIASLVKNGEVAVMDGTSMAAPVVTAVVSSMYSLDTSLTGKKVMKILKKSCRDLGDKGYDTKFGYGCIDASKAVKNVTIKVSSLKISTKSKTLKAGKKITLKVTITPKYATNMELKWTSSNPKVAKVDSKGKVTAVSKGTATITAETVDGSKKKVTCKIKVK